MSLFARLAPPVVLGALALPVLAGLMGTLLPAFGYLPALGFNTPSLDPIRALLAWSGFGGAVWLSLKVGLVSTALALALTYGLLAATQGTRALHLIERALAPLLAIPHAAAALGLAFVIAPSGWLMRLVAPVAGFDRPPDWLIVQDPGGWALILGLVTKEVPFLLLMALAALRAARASDRMILARSLGYGRMTGWAKSVLPAIHTRLRLPVLAVLAYSMSVVDMAVILGPTRPPTLAVQVVIWANDPDLARRLIASAGAMAQLGVVLVGLALWLGGERLVATWGRRWAEGGARGGRDRALRGVVYGAGVVLAGALVLGTLGLAVWSFAGLWRFPDIWPDSLTLRHWQAQGPAVWRATALTALIALAAAGIALIATLALFHARALRGLPAQAGVWVWLPLLVPQVAFVPGLALLALVAGVDGTAPAVMAVHLVFVLPYVVLALAGPWNGWDRRMGAMGATLGAGAARQFWALRLPMLSRALAAALALGFAVSVAQYLPTLLVGGGRVTTLTTEAVALSSGQNRRIIGVWALAQMALPMAGFALALVLPAIVWRNRRGV